MLSTADSNFKYLLSIANNIVNICYKSTADRKKYLTLLLAVLDMLSTANRNFEYLLSTVDNNFTYLVYASDSNFKYLLNITVTILSFTIYGW